MNDEIMITCALTGSGAAQNVHPDLPITPAQIAQAAIDSARAGATVVHIHVRDPKTGAPANEPHLYREVVERIRASNVDVVLNLTTGLGADYVPSEKDPAIAGPGTDFLTPQARMRHVVELRPEICSLDVATMNFGEVAFLNIPAHLRAMARIASEHRVKCELEVFELGHLRLACKLIEEGVIPAPPLFQLCLGISWGAPATIQTLLMMRDMLPEDALWSAFGISRDQTPMIAHTVLAGGNVRVGLEDNLYFRKGEFASNAQLVERAVKLIELLGGKVMSPAQARKRLGLVKA
jgi:uncharacterized protein (DUF849 family)